MEMRAPAAAVASYLDVHQGWFVRCAAPMQVEPVGQNGYHLILGKFGNFGFELEPSIDLELLPQAEGIYRIETIPASRLTVEKDGYAVDFQASLQLVPEGEYTLVEWELDLEVAIRLPAFIQPGGSKRDADSIAACNAAGLTMVFTGRRHFLH
ncbi:MAG: DUF1997 domain-containing protein [Synechococcaceae bacterium WBA_3_309]|nr:DUF1997 domain-containing protein [Synechococcaceae bacterium WBA_3_309]